MFKLKLHSWANLITNSSTTIFCNSAESESALIEMVTEIFKTFNLNLKIEDCFDFVVLPDLYGIENDIIKFIRTTKSRDALAKTAKQKLKNNPDFFDEIQKIHEKIITEGPIKVPDWYIWVLKSLPKGEEGYSTTLFIFPKDEKYKNLAKKITNFLYSTDHFERYD